MRLPASALPISLKQVGRVNSAARLNGPSRVDVNATRSMSV